MDACVWSTDGVPWASPFPTHDQQGDVSQALMVRVTHDTNKHRIKLQAKQALPMMGVGEGQQGRPQEEANLDSR